MALIKSLGKRIETAIIDAGVKIMGGPIDLNTSASSNKTYNPVNGALDYSVEKIKNKIYQKQK